MKKRILIFYDHFYPAYKAGGPIQSLANLVRALHHTYDFYIVCKCHEMNSSTTLTGIQVNTWNNWEDKAQVLYWDYSWTKRSKIPDLLQEIQPDAVYINGLFSLYFNILPLQYSIAYRKKNPACKIILSARGMLHPGALSQKSDKKKLFLSLFRLFGWQLQVQWHATDEQEANFIRNQFDQPINVAVAGNFPNLLPFATAPDKYSNALVMGTIALISPMKNHLAVLQALQKVNAKIHWHIYGPIKDEAYWRECMFEINLLPEHIRIQYHGELAPTDLNEAMESFQVFIMPSKSENFGHALLEALSAGKPLITTNTTPFKALQAAQAGITVDANQLERALPDAIQFFAEQSQSQLDIYATNAHQLAQKFLSKEQTEQAYHNLFTTA